MDFSPGDLNGLEGVGDVGQVFEDAVFAESGFGRTGRGAADVLVLLLEVDVGVRAVADNGRSGVGGFRFDAHAVRAANADDGGHLHAGVGAASGFDDAEGMDLVAGIFLDGVGGMEEEFARVGLLGRRGGSGRKRRAAHAFIVADWGRPFES